MPRQVSRRRFLRQSAAGVISTGFFIAQSPLRASQSPNEKLNIAAVGVSNRGRDNLNQLTSENIVALCDVDERHLNEAATVFSGARKYRDYRKMLEAEANHIDAVLVATADHTHAPATSVALDLKKHVYCEKPLTHTVREARAVAELAARNQLATQMGIQIHAENNYRRVVELIKSNVIGQVKEVYNWCNKGWSNGRFLASQPVPEYLDWDLWLGPAKSRPYSPVIHPSDWRRYWEYGSGTYGDMACHVMDLPFWALDLRHPTSVECEGPERHPDGAPDWTRATYEFQLASGAPLKFYWADGGANFDLVKNTNDYDGQPLSNWGLGILFVGEEGMLAADYGRRQLLPRDKFEGQSPDTTVDIPPSIGHWNEWIQACKHGGTTSCNFDYSGALTETVLLGIVAYRTGKKIEWNASELAATGCPEAEQYLTKEYRKGFEVVGL